MTSDQRGKVFVVILIGIVVVCVLFAKAKAQPRHTKENHKATPLQISAHIVSTAEAVEPSFLHQTAEWDELSSAEKIKRVRIRRLPFNDGEQVPTGSKSKKRFAVRLAKQKQDCFEFDVEGAVTVFIVAKGREAAMQFLAEKISGGRCHVSDAKVTKADFGRFYDGTRVEMEVVGTEKLS